MKESRRDKLLNIIELSFKVRQINLVKIDKPKEYFGKILEESYLKTENGKRQKILTKNLEEFENNRGKFHLQGIRNLIRWSLYSIRPPDHCVVRVVEGDWGVVTLQMTKSYGETFAVLNMANAFGPGGGYTQGMVAQEENIFRRTDCHFSITPDQMDDSRTLYTKKCTGLIEGRKGKVYLDTDRPRVCIRGQDIPGSLHERMNDEDVFCFFELRSAAVDLRRKENRLSIEDYNSTKKRIESQFKTLIEKNVKHVVLSAFGCGAFKNDPNVVADFYKEFIEKYHHKFKVIAFGIFYPGYGPSGNFEAFKKVFESLKNVPGIQIQFE